MTDSFKAMLITAKDGAHRAAITDLTLADLPDNDVLVRISHSSLNYKDGLAISGKGRIARRLPMVAGIDLAGEVVESRSPNWTPGDRVIVNGWGLSETEWGAYSAYQRLKPQHLTRLPDGFSPQEAMAIGTAGYTAALCVLALEDHGTLARGGEFLVTGAAGGVGDRKSVSPARSDNRRSGTAIRGGRALCTRRAARSVSDRTCGAPAAACPARLRLCCCATPL